MRRLGAVLMWAGLGIWGAGIVAWIQSVWVTLPPDTVKVIVLTLAALMGGTLLAAGAAVSRAGQVRDKREMELREADSPRALADPLPGTLAQHGRVDASLKGHTERVYYPGE